MFLLRFHFENHRSFRDEAELVFVQNRLKTVLPPKGESWRDYTNPVVAIYGPNASGKSTVLRALQTFQGLLKSPRGLQKSTVISEREPFRLNSESREAPSDFVMDFVIDELRYQYGISLTDRAFEKEWLYVYESAKKTVLFNRETVDGKVRLTHAARSLKRLQETLETATDARELILTKAASLRIQPLQQVFLALAEGVQFAFLGDMNREAQFHQLLVQLDQGMIDPAVVGAVLTIADLGVEGLEVAKRSAGKLQIGLIEALREAGVFPAAAQQAESTQGERIEQFVQLVSYFRHRGDGAGEYRLTADQQSDGTITWLSLAMGSLRALLAGGVFVVDELDSSLHPHLAEVLIAMFSDAHFNKTGAQLVFTTHQTHFISLEAGTRLSPEEVWFVEKAWDGSSELFSLADYSPRDLQNFAKRYLDGRYGALPSIAAERFSSLLESQARDHETSAT